MFKERKLHNPEFIIHKNIDNSLSILFFDKNKQYSIFETCIKLFPEQLSLIEKFLISHSSFNPSFFNRIKHFLSLDNNKYKSSFSPLNIYGAYKTFDFDFYLNKSLNFHEFIFSPNEYSYLYISFDTPSISSLFEEILTVLRKI